MFLVLIIFLLFVAFTLCMSLNWYHVKSFKYASSIKLMHARFMMKLSKL
jgi:hypothetical protein